MQNPVSEEGALIKREWWKIWEEESPPHCEFTIMTLDAAQEANNRSDYNALLTWGVFWRFLLLRAFNHWDFPKGMVEPGEAPLAAAVREVREETGITDLEFAWGEACTESGPYSRGKVARYYLARTRTSDVVLMIIEDLGRAEHNEFRWVDHDTALKLVPPRVQPILEWAARLLAT